MPRGQRGVVERRRADVLRREARDIVRGMNRLAYIAGRLDERKRLQGGRR